MLFRISTEIAYCLEQAEEARQQAERATSPEVKDEYRNIERCWRTLARSHETVTRRADLVADASQSIEAHKAVAASAAELQPPCPTCGNPMWLTRLSKFDDANDLRTFKCQVCEHVETTIAKSKQ
jgi:hypothetical protein